MNERDYLKNAVICDKEKRILELGPLNRPIIKKMNIQMSFMQTFGPLKK